MFTIDQTITDLQVREKNLVKAFFSMNNHQVATPEMMLEEARSYILFFGEPGGKMSAYIGLHLLQTDRRLFYAHSSNSFAASELASVEEEALIFVEGLGALLDETDFSKQSPEQKNDWIDKQEMFGPKKEAEPQQQEAAPEVPVQEQTAPEPPQPEAVQVSQPLPIEPVLPIPPPQQPAVSIWPTDPVPVQPAPVPPQQVPAAPLPVQPMPPVPPAAQASSVPPAPEPHPQQQAPQAPVSPAAQAFSVPPMPPVTPYAPPAQPQQPPAPTMAHPAAPQRPVPSAAPPDIQPVQQPAAPQVQQTIETVVSPEVIIQEHQPVRPRQPRPFEQPDLQAEPVDAEDDQGLSSSRTAARRTPAVSDTGRQKQDILQKAIKAGIVKPPRPSLKKEVQAAVGVVSRDREALARLFTSF